VGASCAQNKTLKQEATDYTNASPRVDLLAPGGDVSTDVTDDGYVDGILAETINLQDPSSTAWWFYAGTSQSAALISGAAVHLLQAGATHQQATTALMLGSDNLGAAVKDGYGCGTANLDQALDALASGDGADTQEYFAALLPWLEDQGEQVQPQVLISLLDAEGRPVTGDKVYGSFQGASSASFRCTTDENGQCSASADAVDRNDSAGEPLALAWSVRVDTVYADGVANHPGSAFFATDGLEILLAALANEGSGLATSPMGFHLPDGPMEPLGELAEAYSVVDMGSGLATSPMGVIATPPVLEPFATQTEVSLDLDGTGLATSPMGVIQLPVFSFDGSGLATSPMGLQELQLVILGGAGLATSPMGFTALELTDPLSEGFDSELLSSDGSPVLDGQAAPHAQLGENTQAALDAGGWLADESYAAATALVGSGLAEVESEVTGVAGAGAGSTTY